MLEDDIQYIGTRSAQRARLTASNCPFPTAQRRVTGITLHVDKSGAEPVYDMIFRSSTTNVVHIGRRPGSDIERRQRDNESGKAMFRCAVVSRKHAKIAFSDSGHAYLVDLNSHHGTHIRKPGETVSNMLTPETPTLLADGDTITFGKSVGRNNELVRPVTARVELLLGSQSSILSPGRLFKPLHVPDSITSGEQSDRSKPFTRPPSGRYGVYVPSSSSSDISSPISIQDSDIEELPAPSAKATASSPDIHSEFHVGRAFEVLKRLLPPAHNPSVSCWDDSPAIDSHPSASPEVYPRTPSPFTPESPLACLTDFAPSSPRTNLIDLDGYSPVGFDAYSNDVFEDESSGHRSRSASPMDLSSPSPAPSVHATVESAPMEPIVIGAWPGSRSSSPIDSLNCLFTPTSQHIDVPAPVESNAQSPASDEAVASDSRPPSAVPNQAQDAFTEHIPVAPELLATTQNSALPDIRPDTTEVTELKSALEGVRSELAKLQVHRRKYKSRFNANVHIIAEKLTDLDDRVIDVNALCTSLTDQLENVTHVEIPDLQAQIEALQDQAEAVKPAVPVRATSEAPDHEMEDAKTNVSVLRDLVIEMTTLRDNMKRQITIELELVKAARADAVEAIAAQVQTPVLTSLKRKRSGGEDEVEARGEDTSRNVDVGVGVGERADVAATTMVPIALTPTTITNAGGIDVPSPKRAKRIASAVAQTATAITIGAVATWSALAFS